MKKIGIDFDDVLFNFNRSFCSYHNARYGTKVRFEDICEYDLGKVYGTSIEEVTKRIYDFYESAQHDDTEPLGGSVEGVSILKKGNELHLITSRPDAIRPQTVSWLDRYFPKAFTGIHLTSQFGVNAKKLLKSEVCKELGIEVVIEDALHYAEDIALNGVPVILLDMPWNQGRTPELVSRVASWNEAVEMLCSM